MLTNHGILRLKRFGQKFLAGSQQIRQGIFHIESEEQGLTGLLRHMGEASRNRSQVPDQDNGDARNVFLLKIKKM